jgi:phosphoserine phosphatase
MDEVMFVVTLIAKGLDQRLLGEIAHQFDTDFAAGPLGAPPAMIGRDAGEFLFRPSPPFAATDCAALAGAVREMASSVAQGGFGYDIAFDVVVQPAVGREKALLIADMDSTMITVECLDELADYAGIKPQIAAITDAAMRGELDFAGALDARVALLAGLQEDAIDRCLAERVRLMPGARTLVATMRARGAHTVLVSGGFTRFAEPVGRMLGFDRVIANRLEIAGGRLTGTVAKPIVDADTKRTTLLAERDRLALPLAATLAVGDGANDLAMIGLAGLGVAYRAKPVVAAAASARIDHGDLTALLYAQGIAPALWQRSGEDDAA